MADVKTMKNYSFNEMPYSACMVSLYAYEHSVHIERAGWDEIAAWLYYAMGLLHFDIT